jgi:hypothetical protein
VAGAERRFNDIAPETVSASGPAGFDQESGRPKALAYHHAFAAECGLSPAVLPSARGTCLERRNALDEVG